MKDILAAYLILLTIAMLLNCAGRVMADQEPGTPNISGNTIESKTQVQRWRDKDGSERTSYTDISADGTSRTEVETVEKKDGSHETRTITSTTSENEYGEQTTITTTETVIKKPDGSYITSRDTHETYASPDEKTTEVSSGWEVEDKDGEGATSSSTYKGITQTEADGSTSSEDRGEFTKTNQDGTQISGSHTQKKEWDEASQTAISSESASAESDDGSFGHSTTDSEAQIDNEGRTHVRKTEKIVQTDADGNTLIQVTDTFGVVGQDEETGTMSETSSTFAENPDGETVDLSQRKDVVVGDDGISITEMATGRSSAGTSFDQTMETDLTSDESGDMAIKRTGTTSLTEGDGETHTADKWLDGTISADGRSVSISEETHATSTTGASISQESETTMDIGDDGTVTITSRDAMSGWDAGGEYTGTSELDIEIDKDGNIDISQADTATIEGSDGRISETSQTDMTAAPDAREISSNDSEKEADAEDRMGAETETASDTYEKLPVESIPSDKSDAAQTPPSEDTDAAPRKQRRADESDISTPAQDKIAEKDTTKDADSGRKSAETTRPDSEKDSKDDGLVRGPPSRARSGDYESGDRIIDDRGVEYERTTDGWKETGDRYGAITKDQKRAWDKELNADGASLKGEPTAGSAVGSTVMQDKRGSALDNFADQRNAERLRNSATAISVMQQQADMSQATQSGDREIREARRIADSAGQDAQVTRDKTARDTAKAQREQSMGTIISDAVADGIQRGTETFAGTLGAATASRAAHEVFGPTRKERERDSEPSASASQTPSDGDDPKQHPPATIRFKCPCGSSWTDKPPGPSRCPGCKKETASTETSTPESATATPDKAATAAPPATGADGDWISIDNIPVTITWPCGHEWTGQGANAPSWCNVPGCGGYKAAPTSSLDTSPISDGL